MRKKRTVNKREGEWLSDPEWGRVHLESEETDEA